MVTSYFKRRVLARFLRDQDGSASIEAVIIMPMVFWVYLAMFTFFQTYQEYYTNQKAAYTIGDMISRETLPMDTAYMDGVRDLLDYMTRSSGPTTVRITSAKYDQANKRFLLHWSRARGNLTDATQADVTSWTNRIPELEDGEYITITETWTSFSPPFNIGLPVQEVKNFVFTRPRYAPWVLYSDGA